MCKYVEVDCDYCDGTGIMECVDRDGYYEIYCDYCYGLILQSYLVVVSCQFFYNFSISFFKNLLLFVRVYHSPLADVDWYLSKELPWVCY